MKLIVKIIYVFYKKLFPNPIIEKIKSAIDLKLLYF
jgi:hypothetical protein